MERQHPEQPSQEPAPLGSLRELGEVAVGFVGAAAQMVGRDVLHLLHIRRKGSASSYSHEPMTDREVRDWNNKNGFPSNWRN